MNSDLEEPVPDLLPQAAVQPGSLDSEAGIFQMKFDQSGSRLITCEADKTIKVINALVLCVV